MTVNDLALLGELKPVAQGNLQKEITDVFCCDLLSIAMSKAPCGCAWVTVMANRNAIAVASLTDTSCIILAEGIHLNESEKKCAEEEGISVFETELPVFEAALAIYKQRTQL